MSFRVVFFFVFFVSFVVTTSGIAAEPWATFRGNNQRTGSDGKAGPTKPDVLWVHKSQENFFAAPVPLGDHLFLSGFSGFNVPTFYAFNANPRADKRIAWSKGVPVFKLPVVSAPAITDGKLVFGDGMHQTSGALLHCLTAEGQPVWQYPIPGTLVHLEGSPAVAGGKVYFGGGAAGVLCIDLKRVTLDGKEMELPEVRKLLDKKWAELKAKFEIDKKKDPCLARAPTEDDLPKPAPVKLWQQGEKKWHVDGAVAVVGGRVLVASAFLDKEKEGDRALMSLDAATGKIQWRTPLTLNPWGGPAVQGNLVVLGGSSIGYDVNALKGTRGAVAAYDLASGKEKWRKPVFGGGVLASVALTADAAIATATDGKVRAFDLKNGDRRWIYDAKTPFFAPAAVAAGVAYVADLKGVIHAVGLADGRAKWTLDLGSHPKVQAPGMVYGGPILHGGRLFVATCNLAGAFANRPTVVVCIGDK